VKSTPLIKLPDSIEPLFDRGPAAEPLKSQVSCVARTASAQISTASSTCSALSTKAGIMPTIWFQAPRGG
jgi:hypothetical protein